MEQILAGNQAGFLIAAAELAAAGDAAELLIQGHQKALHMAAFLGKFRGEIIPLSLATV